jgi:predicted CXXCH cytochrome family protein
MSDRPRLRRLAFWFLGASVAAAVVVAVWLIRRSPGEKPSAAQAFPPPPYSETRFLNAGPDARYIGSDACGRCHKANHESYLLTAHSRALADLNPDAEPPDGSFNDPGSGRSYRVYRQDGKLRHEEVLRTAEGKEVGRVDVPVRYLIGSGHFTRSYLVEIDGFLHESPITWYTSSGRWQTSPGYDSPQHWGFERPVDVGCVVCHSGRAEPIDGTSHHMSFQEKAIGCENCHGPGSLHEERHRGGQQPTGEDDLTIVHPGKLTRPLQEAICAVCHLSGPANIPVRGRQVSDFRPGRPHGDYRVHYRFEGDDEQMTVVGHVEQLRQSACYQKSEEMTCLTCHDPHARARPKDLSAYYRQKCLGCHTTQACGLDPAERLKKEPADSCVACHMPRGDTEIPHIAFTHHRIGRHAARRSAESSRAPELVPTDDVSHLAPLDRQRNLGLAYLEVSRNRLYARQAEAYWPRARALLEAVHAAGLRDGDTELGLVEIYEREDVARAASHARLALEAHDLSAKARGQAMMILARSEIQGRNLDAAIGLLTELVVQRRFAEDWRLLGLCYLEQRQPAKALPALEQALAIRPFRSATHSALAEAYRQLGDPRRAGEHQDRALWLSKHGQD